MTPHDFAPIAHIQEQAALHFNLPVRVLLARDADPAVVRARHVAIFVASLTGKGPCAIGRRFKRDHSTVARSIRKVAASPSLLRDVEALRARLGGQ